MTNNEESDAIQTAELKAKEKRYWLERALNLLTRREHSIVELRQKLVAKDCEPSLADEIIDICLEQNYLNLERFAEMFVRNQVQLGYGPRKVQYLLKQHQIPNNVVSIVIEETNFEDAKEIALRKIGNKDVMKMRSALYRRGF